MPISNNADIIKIEDIDAALQFGQCFSSKKWTILFMSLFAIFGMEILIAIIGIIIDITDTDWLVMMIMGICLEILVFFPFLYINSGKKKVKLWLKDSVILKARTRKEDDALRVHTFGALQKAAAIQIRFSYMKKHCVKSSVQKGKIACLPVYNKYVDKDILIAYSPKYDQVMLIKPQSEERIRAALDS